MSTAVTVIIVIAIITPVILAVSQDIYETAKLSIDYVKVKTGMPSNVGGEQPVSKLKKPGRVQIIKQEPLRKSEGVCQSEV